jgi:hypothetical protein
MRDLWVRRVIRLFPLPGHFFIVVYGTIYTQASFQTKDLSLHSVGYSA